MKDNIYRELINNMFANAESQFGSVLKFAEIAQVDRFNLSKIKNFKQDISIGLFLKCSQTLNGEIINTNDKNLHSNLSLKEYIEIDNNFVMHQIFKILLQ